MKSNYEIKIIISLTVIIAIILMSIFAPLLTKHDPTKINMSRKLEPMSEEYIFGTDSLGRDVFSRIAYGGRLSMIVALASVVISMSLGLILGLIAGYYGGATDKIITYLSNVFQAIPTLSFMIAITGILGTGIKSLLFGLFVTSWAGFSRIVRVECAKIKKEPFIESMICLGCSDIDIIIKHILPNIMSNMLIIFTTSVGRSLLTISSLSYIGLGITPPNPDWSVMINDARMNFRTSPHLIIIPGLFIFTLIFSINILGNGLRDYFDKRSSEISI